MKCPECGKEMREGYLFCSKDGAFSFANEVPGVFENAKKRRWLCEDHRPQGKPPDESSSLHLRGMQDGHAQVLIEVSATAHIQPEKAPKPLCQKRLGGLALLGMETTSKGIYGSFRSPTSSDTSYMAALLSFIDSQHQTGSAKSVQYLHPYRSPAARSPAGKPLVLG